MSMEYLFWALHNCAGILANRHESSQSEPTAR